METTEIKESLETILQSLRKQEPHHTTTMAIKNVEYALVWLNSRKE